MTIAFVAGPTAANGTTSAAVAYPTVAAGNLLLLAVVNKYPPNGPATPGGWTLLGQWSGGAGAAGSDSGNVYVTVYYKISDGTETGNVTVSVASGNAIRATMSQYSKDAAKSWRIAICGGSDNSSDTSWSVTGDADPGITAGDHVVALSGVNSDASTFSTPSLAASGATLGATSSRYNTGTSSGDDVLSESASAAVSSGTANAAPAFTGTLAANGAGATAIVRLREVTEYAEGFTETVAVSDSLATQTAVSEALAETVSVSDALAVQAALAEQLTETVSVSDALLGQVAAGEAFTETVTADDALAAAVVLVEPLAESVSVTDALIEQIVMDEALLETVVVTDALEGEAVMVETLVEAVTVSDFIAARPWATEHWGRVRVLEADPDEA